MAASTVTTGNMLLHDLGHGFTGEGVTTVDVAYSHKANEITLVDRNGRILTVVEMARGATQLRPPAWAKGCVFLHSEVVAVGPGMWAQLLGALGKHLAPAADGSGRPQSGRITLDLRTTPPTLASD